MKVHPLHDRVLLKRIEEQEVKRGGIIIPDTAKEKPQEAEVIEVGKGRVNDDGKTIPLVVKKGDRSSSASTAAPRSRSTASSS